MAPCVGIAIVIAHWLAKHGWTNWCVLRVTRPTSARSKSRFWDGLRTLKNRLPNIISNTEGLSLMREHAKLA
eukprot:1667842-Pleurochrysis_carterae.AAC.1